MKLAYVFMALVAVAYAKEENNGEATDECSNNTDPKYCKSWRNFCTDSNSKPQQEFMKDNCPITCRCAGKSKKEK